MEKSYAILEESLNKAEAIFKDLAEYQGFKQDNIMKIIERLDSMPKERVDVLAYKQGLFETREQAKRGVMAGLVVNVINGERYDKPGEKLMMEQS